MAIDVLQDKIRKGKNALVLDFSLPMEQLPDDLSLDIVAAKNGYITVMPLTIDRTCLAVYEQLKHLNP